MNVLQKIAAKMLGINTKSALYPNLAFINQGIFSWGFGSKNSQLTKGYENKIIYAVVNVLTKKLIETPILVSKVKSEKYASRIKSYNFSNGNESGKYNAYQAKALDELDDHDLITLLENPNEYQTGIELRESFWMNYNLTGDGYIFVERVGDGMARAGKPVFLHVLNSDKVTAYREGNDWRSPISYYTYSAWNGAQITIDPKDLMHMTKWSPLDPILGGFSPQVPAGSTIEKNNLNTIAQGSAFKNGGTGVIISSDTIVQDGTAYAKLTAEQVASIKETVSRDWAGAHNAMKMHVTNGHVKIDKIGDTLVDLNAINANREDVQFICAVYGVSPILLGDLTGGTENNVAAAYKSLVTNVVVPELRKFDEKFRKFIKDWYKGEKLFVCHDLTEFAELAPDLKLMKEVFGAPILSIDETRKIFNYDEMPNKLGGTFLVPPGLQPLETVIEPPFDIDPNEKQYDYFK